MRVTLREGPNVMGVEMGATVEADELPPDDTEKLKALVGAANLPDAAKEAKTPSLTGDQRKLTISIMTDDTHITADFAEADVPPQIHPLLDFLRERATIVTK